MHKLIEQAKNQVDQAELYWKRTHTISVEYENNRLQEITENDLSSVAVRVIDAGKLGSTSAISPDQDGLIANAKAAAAYGEAVSFSFAPSADYPKVEGSSSDTAKLTSEDLVSLCETVLGEIKKTRDDLPLFAGAEVTKQQLIIETTEGAQAHHESTVIDFGFGAPIRGAGMPVLKTIDSVSPITKPEDQVEEFLEWYEWSEKISTPKTGRLPVIFAPLASPLYLLPLWAGLEGDAIEKKTSPLVGRVGELILSERLTIVEDPLASAPGSRPFDDEAIPCQRREIVDKGELKGYLLDLRTAASLGTNSTGNAVKRELFGGGTETKPSPWPIRFTLEPGDSSYRDMIAGLDEGLLLYYGMGFHSGNYPQGQFSIQAIGFHIKNGAVVGRLDKTMVSANIYEDFKHIRAISKECGPAITHLHASAPYVLVDSLQVAGA